MSDNSRRLAAPLATLAILAVWSVLAYRSPTLTYHFAPLLAAAAWPVLERRSGSVPRAQALVAAVGAFAATTATGVALTIADRLEGPALWDRGHALWEVVIFAAVASAWALRVATRDRPGLIGALVGDQS